MSAKEMFLKEDCQWSETSQKIWIDTNANCDPGMKRLCMIDKKKKKTLYHELTHVYIREYLTSRDIDPNEEVLCDISANSHDIIHKIIENYFKEV